MSLSDEIFSVDECDVYNDSLWIREDDVKEFINDLKKEIAETKDIPPNVSHIFHIIDKLAGDKLI